MRAKFVFLVLAALGVVNIASFSVFAALEPDEPRLNVFLRPQADGIVLVGKNYLGIYRFRSFANWDETKKYLNDNGLSLASLDSSKTPKNTNFKISKNKVLWSQNNARNVVRTPDQKSAVEFAAYIQHGALESSIMGFAIPLRTGLLAR